MIDDGNTFFLSNNSKKLFLLNSTFKVRLYISLINCSSTIENVSTTLFTSFNEDFLSSVWSLLCAMVKISSSYALIKPSFMILFLSKEALNGDEISISLIENVLATLFSVEKKNI